jgi:hypothetical protein
MSKMKNSKQYDEHEQKKLEDEQHDLWRIEQEFKQIPQTQNLFKSFQQIFGESK